MLEHFFVARDALQISNTNRSAFEQPPYVCAQRPRIVGFARDDIHRCPCNPAKYEFESDVDEAMVIAVARVAAVVAERVVALGPLED